jgi:predicted nuclease of predicted toxin-antitoxin system
VKILVDMNLSPAWVSVLDNAGFEAIHWSSVGDPRAIDEIVMLWASEHNYVVFTHDLDFGTILATTRAAGPSVIQVRTQDVTPAALSGLVIGCLQQFATNLEAGAIISVDENQLRSRILPITPREK